MFARRFAAGLALLLATGFASAQQGPQLNTVFPPGAKAGETIELTFTGLGFDGEEKLLFSEKGFESDRVGSATVDPKAPKGQGGNSVKFKVTVPKNASAGTLDVRVVSKGGLSNPRAFAVGSMTEANESEPNNDVDQAQQIALNTTANGTISAPTDVDYVRFSAKAGQNIVVYCLTTSIDSKLSADLLVATPDGKRLAENRGYRGGDAVLDFKAPADGDYLVRLSQFAYSTGGSDHFYRLTVTDGPWVDALFPPFSGGKITPLSRTGQAGMKIVGGSPATATGLGPTVLIPPSAAMIDAIDPPHRMAGGNLLLDRVNEEVIDNEKNNTAGDAQPVKPPCDIAGRIGKKNDRHWYSFDARKGEVWTLEVFADRIGSQMDAYFVLTDEKGKVIAEADDGPDSLSPNQFYTKSDDPARYRFNVPADGQYRVMVSSREASIQFGVREQYVLRIAKENPDFRIAVMPDAPHLPDAGTVSRGGAVQFAVFVFRMDGFNEPIELSASGLPAGVKCPKQIVGAGQVRSSLVFTADKDAKDWEGFVTITAKSGKLEHTARPFTITWTPLGLQANQPPPNSPMITRMDRGPGLALAVRGDAPFTLVAVEKEITTKPGGKIELTLKLTRDPKFKDGVQVFSGVPGFGPRQQGNQPVPPITTVAADKNEVKLSVDVNQSTVPGTYTLVLTGRPAAPPPKGGNNNVVRPTPAYPSLPVTVVVEGTPKKK